MSTDLEDNNLLSQLETAPTAPADLPPDPDEAKGNPRRQCPECGATTNAMGLPFLTDAALKVHRARGHGVVEPGGKGPMAPKGTAPKKAPGAAKKVPGPKKTTTQTSVRRPLGPELAKIFLQLGRIINTVEPATGATIMFEAGALGEAIDKLVVGTFVDKSLQKAATASDRFAPLVPLVTLPAMIFMVSHNEAMGGMLEGEIREAMEDVLIQSLPLLRKRAQRSKAAVDALAELRGIRPDLAESEDPIGEMINELFTGPPAAEQPGDGVQ